MADSYVFEGTHDREEWDRLKMIETICDPHSKEMFSLMGSLSGSHCLEVGPGRGSLIEWLSTEVGPSGQVVAVDLNPRFVMRLASSTVKIVKGDIASVPLPEHFFDVIHGRYVLLHMAEQRRVIQRLVSLLKPGGWMCFEEPDFELSFCATSGDDSDRIDRVHAAVQKMYRKMGRDPGTGRKLPAILSDAGLHVFQVKSLVHLNPGNTIMAEMMNRSISHIRSQLLKTEIVDNADLDAYLNRASDSSFWNLYYTTVSVVAKK